jgi:hypothetical protein
MLTLKVAFRSAKRPVIGLRIFSGVRGLRQLFSNLIKATDYRGSQGRRMVVT